MVYFLSGLCPLILLKYTGLHFSVAPPTYCNLAAFKHFLSGVGEIDESVVRALGNSCRGPRCNPQPLHGGSQPSVTLLTSTGTRHTSGAQTCKQNIHMYKIKINLKKQFLSTR